MNIKLITTISLKSLNMESIENIRRGAFKNTGFNPKIVFRVVGNIIEDGGDFYIDTNNYLYNETDSLSINEKFEYIINNREKYNIFVNLANCRPIEYEGIQYDLESCNLTLEAFKLRTDISEEKLKKYNNMSEERKLEDFYEYNQYRGFCEDIYSKTFYADEDGIDFGGATDDKSLGLIVHLNNKDELEVYGCSLESWGMCSGGYRLINNIGSFKDTVLKFINDITR